MRSRGATESPKYFFAAASTVLSSTGSRCTCTSIAAKESTLIFKVPTCCLPETRSFWPLLTSTRLQELALLQFGERLLQLFLCVHHDGTVPRNGFLEWFPGDEQESDSVVAS